MHGSVWVADESRVLLGLSSLVIFSINRVGSIGVLFFRDIQVIVNKKLSEGYLLLKTSSIELVSDCTSIISIDHNLIAWLSKRQMVDCVSEIKSVAVLHDLHDGVGTVM